MSEAKIRLYVDQPLAAGQPVAVSPDQANYLFNVMRLGRGAAVALFNGADGEWLASVAEAGKRGGILICQSQTALLRPPPDLWLIFAPLKKARTDFVVEKAVELGAARLLPVQTRHTNSERIRQDKMQAHATEAAEQCGATYVPQVAELVPLDRLLATWPAERALYWCDEAQARPLAALQDAGPDIQTGAAKQTGAGPLSDLAARKAQPSAILIGPEGGFSADEQTRLRALPFVHPLALGPRILRAETAAVAALVLWQASLGDWTGRTDAASQTAPIPLTGSGQQQS